jgi:hypothetical protein
MARSNRTGTRLTTREVRNTYPALDLGFFGLTPSEEVHFDASNSEVGVPEYTSNPCPCVAPCPAGTWHSRIRPLKYLG